MNGLVSRDMQVERQYIDFYAKLEDVICMNAPECMNRRRKQAFMDFKKQGFPTLKDEDYRRTDVAAAFAPDFGVNFNRYKTQLNPAEVFRCDVPNMSTQLFFIINDSFNDDNLPASRFPKGVYVGGLKTFAENCPEIAAKYYGQIAKTSEDSITALNTMYAQDGFVLYVPENVRIEKPIQLVNVFRSAADIMANRRILVIMEPGSQAQLLVCDHTMDEIRCLATQVVEIFVGEGAAFDYYDLEESSVSTARFSSLYVRQEAASNTLIDGITLNNGLTRNNYRITLAGEGADTTLCGMSILDRDQHIDAYTHIDHAVPRCRSRELFKNVLRDKAVGIFTGRILVEKGAEKTEACQTNRNLCLTNDACAYSRPQLEIYADDVKCTHGMTTGQLDEQALFYMQSRGLSREEARILLSVAFTSDVIENVRLDALKDRLHYLVEKRFRGELAQCADCRVGR